MTEAVALITTAKVATKFGVSASAVRKWVAEGKLTPAVSTPGGHHRFRVTDVDALLAESTEQSA